MRVDVMLRVRRQGVGACGYHAGFSDGFSDFFAWQMAADARFCALPNLDFYGCACVEVFGVNAESARRHLHDGVVAVLVETLV